jgi:hypothetical protein
MIVSTHGILANSGIPYIGLLDTYSGATAAYSLRKLKAAYTGFAVRVRRSSDNTTLDVGFDANGNLDTTSLLSFVGGVNQIQYSEEFDNAYWGKVGVTVTANNTTAPDGTMTADLITETVSNSYHVFGRYGASGTWASGTSYNTSVFIKRTTDVNSPTRVAFAFDYGSVSQKPYVIFNIENGTVESYNFFTDINTGYSITDSGNGWWRISMWGTLTASQTSFESGALIRFNNNLSTISTTQYTPLSGSSVYLWGYQLTKLGTNLQPYSKTTTITAGYGFMSIWYDQSGNGYDLIQATPAQQPRIVNTGTLEVLNGKVALRKPNTSTAVWMRSAFGTTITQPQTTFSVGSHLPTGTADYLWSGNLSSTNRNDLYTSTANTITIFAGGNVTTSYIPSISTQRLIYAKYNSSSSLVAVNDGTGTSGDAGTQNINGITLGGVYNAASGADTKQYYFNEHIIFSSNQDANRTGISNNINTYYNIY